MIKFVQNSRFMLCSLFHFFAVIGSFLKWIREQAASCNNKIVVVEDHYAQGGIGGAIAEALMEDQIRIKHLCVREIPRSGPSAALMNMFKIDAEAIVEAVESFQQ